MRVIITLRSKPFRLTLIVFAQASLGVITPSTGTDARCPRLGVHLHIVKLASRQTGDAHLFGLNTLHGVEALCEPSKVEARIDFPDHVQQFFIAVPAGTSDRIHIEKIASHGPREQGLDLVAHRVINR